jgi:tRNA1(Val) A37 N6-methylase TrmN6
MRDYSKFYTPTNVANEMIFLARPIRSTQYWLEPSAGNGNLIKALRETDDRIQIHAVEINKGCEQELIDSGARAVFIGDFLEYQPDFLYDRILANPPFGNNIDIKAHFDKMYSLLKQDGKLVCILPADFEPDCYGYVSEPLDNWSTNKDGSITPIRIVTAFKQAL